METNFLFIVLAAFIPMAMGMVWYHPKLFGKAWMEGVGVSQEVLNKGPKPVIFVFALILSFMLSFLMYNLTAHQSGLFSLFSGLEGFGQEGSEVQKQFDSLMEQFAGHDRNFGHGAFHGVLVGLFFAFPVLATNGMFEFKSWKHNAINVGYWVVTLGLMGGIVCQWA